MLFVAEIANGAALGVDDNRCFSLPTESGPANPNLLPHGYRLSHFCHRCRRIAKALTKRSDLDSVCSFRPQQTDDRQHLAATPAPQAATFPQRYQYRLINFPVIFMGPPLGRNVRTTSIALGSGLAHVRFGSKADMCSANGHGRSTTKSGHVRCN